MKLGAFLAAEKLTQDKFAQSVGVTHATVSRWQAGRLLPSAANMLAILRATGGKVRPEDFVLHAASDTAPDTNAARHDGATVAEHA